ncbi:MFS-type transporter involved in bile tolerance, Atg22 family [Lutispora thermophila DSM 19022]|uniref:MFS-type transporter involved in bile tolerance, Atg22 family n=2 Tax=Lutispora TaxID=667112 RepID=A0A1M6FWS7_9FIRM|nr:MFS-type transporter involved in bile tolerance, Atg22 family [Lutispora thermophila DSM 19022]
MYRDLIRNRNLSLLCMGGFISGIGDYLYNIAITIYLYSQTNSVGSVAIMWLFRGILRIPMQYLGGIITDKYDRKKIIVFTNALSIPIAFLFVLTNKDNLWLSYFLAFLLQSLNDVDQCAENAMLPEIVEKDDLANANSIFSVLQTIILFLSPALSGIIYTYYGANVLFIINAVSFLIASILFLLINYEKSYNSTEKRTGLIKSGIEGFKLLSECSNVKIIFIIMFFYGMLGRFYEVFKVAVSDNLLKLGPEGIIYFDYALAIGSLAVPISLKVLKKYEKVNIFIISSTLISISYIVFGFSGSPIITLVILVLYGLLQSIQGVYSNTVIQENIPKELLGRIFSFYKILIVFGALLGIAISPIFYEYFGPGMSFTIVSVISVILNFVVLLRKNLHKNIASDDSV